MVGWSFLLAAIFAAVVFGLRGVRVWSRHVQSRIGRGQRPLQLHLDTDVFDAHAWPDAGPAEVAADYRRPADIRANDPAILPPPRQLRDEDFE